MRMPRADLIPLSTTLAASALLLGLSGCGGGGGGTPEAAAPVVNNAPAQVITESNIKLPTSVQVVSAK